MALNYGNGENVWMHPPVHRILGWYSRPSNFDLKRNVWRLNQISQIIDNEIYVKGDPAISDLATLNRFPTLIEANLINKKGSKIGVIADFLFEIKTGKIKYYLVSRANPKIPGSSRWKLNIDNKDDQNRIMTPHEAIDNGASKLVIGRSISKAIDPNKALIQIFKSINSG